MTKVGDKVRVTPDPAFFTDPSDYRYVMRPDSSVVGQDLTVAAIFPAGEALPGLPRSGVVTYKLVDDLGMACWLAVDSEIERSTPA